MNDYSFQIEAAQKIAQDCENPIYLGAVLASAVNSGKTQILIRAINHVTIKNPHARILYLAYAQRVILNQTLEAFSDAANPIKPTFTFGVVGSGNQVEVGIPQEFKKLTKQAAYTHLVIDESHVWFTSPSVMDRVIGRFGIKKLILATGTPSLFNSYNKWTTGKKFSMTFIAGEEMLRRGIYSEIDLDLVRVPSYTATNRILELTWQKAKEMSDDFSRPVVVCKNSRQALEVTEYLSSIGYSVALAASGADPDNIQIQRFKDNEATALVLINRGILGLNISQATIMIFLKKTKNPELILQAMARMFRVHPSGVKKSFYMPATSEEWNEKIRLLYLTVSLINLNVMKEYCGVKDSRVA